ncbi:Maf family protein [Curvivirga aplysinae]|uniref:Maf family protein n=1 Tax=Curvivirga aplysinae TaxID=2529852 RepID=UPI0012BD7B8B|nr:Maf family protein [Curvivirga aplysinae]MTI09079.1 septum formation protein Maf [Curvivirga aplysinae]
MTETSLVLASASKTRAALLQNAGINVTCDPANVDEDSVKIALKGEGASAVQVAETLAELKAQAVSRRHPGVMVIGADQTLDCEGHWFDKPENMDQARENLKFFRGKKHRLNAAVCIVKDGQRLWHVNDPAEMHVRDFSDEWLDWYLNTVGDEICDSVGGYRLEGPGSQLFATVRGDYFTVLGLPLLPLMQFLRGHKTILP